MAKITTVEEMIAEGYKLATVCGRKVLVKYFPEYDETFLVPINAKAAWNFGEAFGNWSSKLIDAFYNEAANKHVTCDKTSIKLYGIRL